MFLLDVSACHDVAGSLDRAKDAGFDGIVATSSHPLIGNAWRKGGPSGDERVAAVRTETAFGPLEDWSRIVHKLSSAAGLWSRNPRVVFKLKEAILREAAAAAHVGASAMILSLRRKPCEHFVHLVRELISPCNVCPKLILSIPFQNPEPSRRELLADDDAEEDVGKFEDTWKWWNELRAALGDDVVAQRRLSVNLEIPNDLPSPSSSGSGSSKRERAHRARWLADSVSYLSLPKSVFVSRPRGDGLALSGRHERLVRRFLVCGASVVIQAQCGQETEAATSIHCLKDILGSAKIARSRENPYSVILHEAKIVRFPFQHVAGERPLAEIVGNRPARAKEEAYRRAAARALSRVKKSRPGGPADKTPLNVAMVGLQHHSLISEVVEAAASCGVSANIYVLETRHVTFSLISMMYCGLRSKNVQVDVRLWDPATWRSEMMFDLIVSDAFGVFGDDGGLEYYVRPLERNLHGWGLVVPSSVSSFLVPVQSSPVFDEVALVKLVPSYLPDGCWNVPWTFSDDVPLVPAADEPVRVQTLNFPRDADAARECDGGGGDRLCRRPTSASASASVSASLADLRVHGLVGYFEACLCEEVVFGNGQRAFSAAEDGNKLASGTGSMLFLPLKKPFDVHIGDKVRVDFAKLASDLSFWYQWKTENLGQRKELVRKGEDGRDPADEDDEIVKKLEETGLSAEAEKKNYDGWKSWHNRGGRYFELLAPSVDVSY